MNKRILLYYKYIPLYDIAAIKIWQHELCVSLGLTGRVLLALEGINGTVCGDMQSTSAYIDAMNARTDFGNIDFKESIVDAAYEYFPNLQVKIKKEIVNFGISSNDIPVSTGGKHLSPQQAHALMTQPPENFVILDGRNAYEARVGKFNNAIVPPINFFRDFPNYINQNLDLFKDKQVLMYCTGGVRCEMASAYLKSKNVTQEVYQIEGGIHRYVEEYPDGYFRGKNYVFDARITTRVTDDILTTCDLCQITCDEFTNCANALCNKRFVACSTCLYTLHNTCGESCYQLVTIQKVPLRPPLVKAPY